MANYATLKAAIQQVIKTNGNNEITGALLQSSLLALINVLGNGYRFAGVANLATTPGTPDNDVFYFAGVPGTYANFDGIQVAAEELAILRYNGTWTKETIADLSQTFDEFRFIAITSFPLVNTGLLNTGGTFQLNGVDSTNYIAVVPGMFFRALVYSGYPVSWASVVGYDVNKANPQIIETGTGLQAKEIEFTIPEGVAYIRVSSLGGERANERYLDVRTAEWLTAAVELNAIRGGQ